MASRTAPPYTKRAGWIPRTVEDFGDGGAFPEVHVAQYPLNMGRAEESNSNALAVQLDAAGKVKYDVLARQVILTSDWLMQYHNNLWLVDMKQY